MRKYEGEAGAKLKIAAERELEIFLCGSSKTPKDLLQHLEEDLVEVRGE
jgi:hypothetical protein